MRASEKLGRWRWLVLLAVFGLVAAACQGGGTTTSATTDGTGTTATTTGEVTTTTAATETGFTYRLGIFQDTTTDNYWNRYGSPTGGTVWNAYVLDPTKPALYQLNYPGLELDSDLAASAEVPTGQAEGDGWAIEVPMREDGVWSDGTPITANDIVFTYETVRDLALGGDFLSAYPIAAEGSVGLTSVEAVSDYTVKFVFNSQPGLAIWPHNVGLAPVMAAHIWTDIVEEAKASEDPAAALYAATGTGVDVSGGPMVFAERQESSFSRNVANDVYYDRDRGVTSAGVTYTVGPFAGESIFTLYGGQDAAVLALAAGDVDYLLNPLGMQRGLLAQVENNPELTAVVNPTNGFRYLAFNLRKEPMSLQGFRDALAMIIDKEFMANNVLQGVAFPLYATVPSGNTKWYNEEAANTISSQYVGKPTADRLNEAIALLEAEGFSWVDDAKPTVDDAGQILRGGDILLNGNPVETLEIIAPGPGYDPLRSTYSIWIETWLNYLGFDAEANPTDFNALVAAAYPCPPEPDAECNPDFDMYILGWSLGNPAFPTYHEAFFHSKNDHAGTSRGDNAPGYNNPEFDALSDAFSAAQSEEEAFDLMWQMEEILAQDKPYVLLFDTGILEFYRQGNVNFPFTQTLSGLQFLNGMQGLVTSAR
ncbi:MAG TPA: ABC transporter substrate-binding protein [Acidimicrobiia bacterium]|nr:ABC transporter substrate-binding protein [Acidimicrobiia bacterium]